jgi:hypothetical protein
MRASSDALTAAGMVGDANVTRAFQDKRVKISGRLP